MSSSLGDTESHVETELVDVGGLSLPELRIAHDAAVVRSLRHVVAGSTHVGVTEVNCAGVGKHG